MRDKFREWCEDGGGTIERKKDDSLICHHPADETREYADIVVLDENDVSMPDQWSGWIHGALELQTENDGMVVVSQDHRTKIEFGENGFDMYLHEDDDNPPELEEMYETDWF